MVSIKPRFVGYLRVSTRKQEASGLGLDAQRSAVRRLVAERSGELIAEFVEVESGRKADRPQLLAAISRARRQKAILLVARLDRLGRSVSFTSALMESGIEFLCCDNPFANRLTIHILCAIAEHERLMISERTKAALAAAKQRGTLLGSHRPGHWSGRETLRLEGLEKARMSAAKSNRAASIRAYDDIAPRLLELRDSGLGGDRIAKILTAEGIHSRRGPRWTGAHVRRVLARLMPQDQTK